MKRLKKLKGLYAARIDGNEKGLILFAIFVLILAAVIVTAFHVRQTAQPRYDLEAGGAEIDFTMPEVKAHTAEDGIAVVRAAAQKNESIATDLVPTAAEPARFTADPAAIWQDDKAGSISTHGGFTLPAPMDGESIGVLTIPDIGLSVRVYESDDEMADMTKGAAHFKSTSAWDGNVGLSAHNINLNGSAGYFLNLYKLQKGAVIKYETALGKREYAVESVTEISETDWSRLGRTQDNRITLITCITGKPSLRLCVQAVEK